MKFDRILNIASLILLAGSAYFYYNQTQSRPSYSYSSMTNYLNKHHQGVRSLDKSLAIGNDGEVFIGIQRWNKDKKKAEPTGRYAPAVDSKISLKRYLEKKGIGIQTRN